MKANLLRRMLLAVAAMGLAGWVVWARGRPPVVAVQRPQRASIEQTVVATGRVLSPAKINLGVLVQGIVGSVRVDEGQHVRAGDVLLTLQDDEFQALAKQAQGNLGLANAKLMQLARDDARLAKEQLVRAEAELHKAEADYARSTNLERQGAIATTELIDAEAALARAREVHESASIRVQATGASGSEAQASRATVTNAQGALDFVAGGTTGTGVSRSVSPGAIQCTT